MIWYTIWFSIVKPKHSQSVSSRLFYSRSLKEKAILIKNGPITSLGSNPELMSNLVAPVRAKFARQIGYRLDFWTRHTRLDTRSDYFCSDNFSRPCTPNEAVVWGSLSRKSVVAFPLHEKGFVWWYSAMFSTLDIPQVWVPVHSRTNTNEVSQPWRRIHVSSLG